jgi:PAS domain S-box-containing protein
MGFAATLPREVLLIHSFHKGFKWSDAISSAIERELATGEAINLTTVYMDSKKIATSDYFDKLADLYKTQFSTRIFDLVIVSDNNAFNFVIRYHDYLFAYKPVLFCGVNNFDKAFLQENDMQRYMTGVVEQVDLEKNVDLILKIHPKLKKLVIISDLSKTGQAIRRDLRRVIPKYREEIDQIEYIDNISMEALKQRVQTLGHDAAILFVLFSKDKQGKFFTYKESISQIRSASQVPIYGLWDFYLDYGMMGGLLTSADAQGEAVARMALEVLAGKPISEIPIMDKPLNRYMFDYHELERFGITIRKHLDDYEVVNEPFSFYNEYRNLVNGTLLLFLLFLTLILMMRQNIQRRKKVEIDLSNQLKFDRVLLDTLPNPIYYKDTDGRFLGCNLSFAKLVKHKRQEVIGKTAYDFFPKKIATKNAEIDQGLLRTMGTSSAEFTLHTVGEGMRYFTLNKAVYDNIDGSVGGIVCIMDDTTERIQQKQFLIQQSKLAEMGDMIAAVAHQWNEPLVDLSAEVQDIELSYMLGELKDAQVKEFVHDSMVKIQYMSQTLSDFRNFLKPSTKKVLFGIRKSLEEIFDIISKQFFYSNIKLTVAYASAESNLLIYGYQNEFKQVLLNILNNAKSKILQSAKDPASIHIHIYSDKYHHTIEISDDAGAIPEEIISSIFDPYFTTKADGTGIGLYMAKVIIEDKMTGEITVQNSKDRVVFTIKIPNHSYGVIA